MSSDDKDLASVKCTFAKESRVILVRKDIPYNAFILKVTEEFGIPLVVDTYEDAEGEMITLGDNAIIADLGTQLSFGAKHRPYALKVFLRKAGTRRASTNIFDRRPSSDYSEEVDSPQIVVNRRPSQSREPLQPSRSFTPTIHPGKGTPPVRRDSRGISPIDEEHGRRGSTGDQTSKRASLVDLHTRHSSAGLDSSGNIRRSSADSDCDALDEVSWTGPWEPPFARPPQQQGMDFLDYLIQNDVDPRGYSGPLHVDSPQTSRPPSLGIHVDIPVNHLHTNVMAVGSLANIENGGQGTPNSASSALKTPTRISPMISPFGHENRFPHNYQPPIQPNQLGNSGPVTFVEVPARHLDEPEYGIPAYKSMSSNGSNTYAGDLPSFHQNPFPQDSNQMPPQPGFHGHLHSPITQQPTPNWRTSLKDSADIEITEASRFTQRLSDSSEDDIDVVESIRRGNNNHVYSPIRSPQQPENHQTTSKEQSLQPPSTQSNQTVQQSNRITDLRSPVGKSRRAESVTPASPKPLNLAWKKGDLIGRGGFGSVYKGLLSNGQFVAVKQLELPPDVDPTKNGTYSSFMKEIDMLKALKHPNIVRYIGSTVEGHTINVFLEYVPGGSIASMISKFGPFDESMMKLYAKNILQALSYLHKNNIAHRDIKGANILVDTQGVAKLADFGCSKSISLKSGGPGENFQTMLGTPYWMAPEVMRQEGHGRMADIWSFGCTLIEMASGKPPWAKEYTQIFALLWEVGNSQRIPDIPKHLSPELKDLLLQCFRRTPADRPTPDELLKHPWFNDPEDDEDEETDNFDASSLPHHAHSPLKKTSLSKSMSKSLSAALSLALQAQPKSLDQLPESVLLQILCMLSSLEVTHMARTCSHLRYLAQRNVVWMSLSFSRWPKLRRTTKEDVTSLDSPLHGEVDYWKKNYVARVKYDQRWANEPIYRQVRAIKGHSKKVYALQLLEGATKLISCAADKKIKIWEIASAAFINQPASPASPSSAHSSFSASNLTASTSTLTSSGSISNGTSSATSSMTSSTSSKKKKASTTLRGHNAAVTCFHAGTKTTLISGSMDGTIKVWDMKSKKCTTTIKTNDQALTGLQFHETSGHLVTSYADGTAKVWDLKTLDVMFTLTGHKSQINALRFHGNTLATASNDRRVKIWDLQSGAMVKSLHGHKDEVLCVDLVGDTVLAGAADGALLEWSLSDKSASAKAYPAPPNLPSSPVTCVYFDGVNCVIAGRADGLVLLYKFHTHELHSSFKADSGSISALTAYSQVLATAGTGDKIIKVWALI